MVKMVKMEKMEKMVKMEKMEKMVKMEKMEKTKITNKEQLRNTKIRVSSDEENKKVQKVLFSLGCYWGSIKKIPQFLRGRFLFINESLRLTYTFDYDDDITYFEKSQKKEIKVIDILTPLLTKIINGVEYC